MTTAELFRTKPRRFSGITEHLKGDIGVILVPCLQELVELRPADPIVFIAYWLYRYACNKIYFMDKATYGMSLLAAAEQLSREKAKRAKGKCIYLAELERLKALIPREDTLKFTDSAHARRRYLLQKSKAADERKLQEIDAPEGTGRHGDPCEEYLITKTRYQSYSSAGSTSERFYIASDGRWSISRDTSSFDDEHRYSGKISPLEEYLDGIARGFKRYVYEPSNESIDSWDKPRKFSYRSSVHSPPHEYQGPRSRGHTSHHSVEGSEETKMHRKRHAHDEPDKHRRQRKDHDDEHKDADHTSDVEVRYTKYNRRIERTKSKLRQVKSTISPRGLCHWYMVGRAIVCDHPVLGILRPPVNDWDIDSIGKDGLDRPCWVYCDHEVYTTCK